MLKRQSGGSWVSSAFLKAFYLLLAAPTEMLYATDIPHNKQPGYITLRLRLHILRKTASQITEVVHIYIQKCSRK